MTEPRRLGLVGCGRLAEAGYVPALRAAAGVEVVAVADPDAGRRDAIGELLSIARERRHESDSALLDAGELDAVLVASPVTTHVAVATRVAEAGLLALVEKPPAEDAAGARALAALDPAPTLAFNRRFSLGREAAARPPLSGELEIEGTLHYRRESWQPMGELGDAWLDLGPHLVDLALVTSGRSLSVAEATLAERRANVKLTGRGVKATFECATDRPHRERFRVRLAGRTVIDSRDGGLRGLVPRPGRVHPLVASLAEQLESFAALLGGEGRPGPQPATAADGVAVMRIVDEARLG